ncbi:hypothetical protein SCUCBS95973_001542 [Sporothrix curviconia]|uniref:BZIP domain-containing protein n=1 Tax=Sporothrix curviconia TaxID=1260050 RepID=A0ABP0AZF6_9PEZI
MAKAATTTADRTAKVEKIEDKTGDKIADGITSTTNDGIAASKPKARSVDFLTPEQLRRKREGDRISQKHARQRTKALVEHLQARVQELELRNNSLAQDLSTASNALALSMITDTSIAHETVTDGSWSDLGKETPASTALSRTMRLDCNGIGTNGVEAALTEMIGVNYPGLDFTMWEGVSGPGFDDKAFQPNYMAIPYSNGMHRPPSLPQQPPPPPPPQAALLSPPHGLPPPTADAHLIHPYHTIAKGQHVWSTLPPHLPATCLLDEVVIDILLSRRLLESSGGNNQEFQRRNFPSIQSLLNPVLSLATSLDDTDSDAALSSSPSSPGPVTNTIVNKIIHVMTVPTLPEQIAILYVMSSVIRWLISPTESNYDAMPEWLRPTPSQLVEPHPPWVDLFVWPRGREQLCRLPQYHAQNALMSRLCNETISINWPHHPSDMILQMNGTEYVLNPIFDRHIKNVSNWTIGKEVVEA